MTDYQTTIYHYKVETSDGSGILSAEKRFDITQLDVIGQNEEYLVVNDLRFTTLKKRKERGEHPTCEVIGRCSISIYNSDKCWGNRIWLSLYSEKPVTTRFIRAAIETEIEKRFGYFTGKIDLSFITEKANAR
jgi:hypothetical protein